MKTAPRSLVGKDLSRDPQAVRAMFGRIAQRYDLANHVLSGGADFLWRRRAAKIIEAWQPQRLLDLATGSGDLALALQRRLPKATIVAADFSPEMLEVARRKGVRETILADALQLPFEAGSFDCVTVAFGLRNMADWGAALREMSRVLRGGGHLLVLDFSLPSGALRPVYRFYLHRCLPLLASVVTGQRDAYDYLGGSIEKFPSGGEMIELMEKNGFSNTSAEPLTGGIATIYIAHL
ncbi:MAG TPA: bifunctional demethylmenaquinone methyltransferase/2-methoxy-6-polyprenyl-1,4-benzoquinol methylase UbiE [Chthoniobacterales bacterium]|nr:bifunctional demethylmenaquinone methyltransferase/2-methoxy-6-polyprenyl-1,4-benzoquinol methylase UbiE [Chthoniobacterales bacterium]